MFIFLQVERRRIQYELRHFKAVGWDWDQQQCTSP